MTTQERYNFAFEKGNEAYNAGQPKGANPYIKQTAEASGWADGWNWGKIHDL